MYASYSRLLGLSLNHKRIVIGGAVVLLAVSAGLVPLIGTEVIPEQDQGQLQVSIELPEGTRMEETGMLVHAVEHIICKNVPEQRIVFSSWGIGEEGISTLLGGSEGSNIGSLYVRLVSKENRGRSPKEIAEALRPHVSSFPGADAGSALRTRSRA